MGVLEILVVILLVLWLGGVAIHVGGSLIHLLLLIVLVLVVVRLTQGKRI